MTAEEKCAAIKEVYQWAMFAAPGRALYLEDQIYVVRNSVGQVVLVRAASEVDAIEQAEARHKWNNHTFACLLAEMFDDTCACNYNAIAEWLPEKCELLDACPNPVGVACWEQFLKHREEIEDKEE